MQIIDPQWRSILIDNAVANGGWERKDVTEFWKSMSSTMKYQDPAQVMLQMMSLPQSTTGVERTFSKVNANKTRLQISLSVARVYCKGE